MWWVNIAFGIFAALVHVPISNEPHAELLEGRQQRATNGEQRATTNTAALSAGSKTTDNMP